MVMRASLLAVVVLACTAFPAPAQSVFDVEGQKAASPPASDQGKAQTQDQVPAQESVPPVPPSRFTFSRVDNGFLRLDNDSGQVAFCKAQGRGWVCQAAAEDHSALETQIAGLQEDVTALKVLKDEIAGLQDSVAGVKKLQTEIACLRDEVASLRKDVVALKEPPPPPADLTPADRGGDATIKLPTREDMARVRAFIQDTIHETWRRLVEMINTVQKDMMRKG
jgi:hypothetical protein